MWAAEWGPFGDIGGHVELMDVFARGHDPSTAYPSTYRVAAPIGPNVLSLHVARWLHPVLGAKDCARLLLSVYAVTLPLGLLAACVAFRRNPWLSLAAVPLSFNAMLNMGALNYLLGLPLMLLTVAATRRWIDRRSLGLGALLVALVLIGYFTHLITCAMACAFSLVLLVLHARRVRHVSGFLASAGGLGLIAWWVHSMSGDMTGGDGSLGVVYQPFAHRVLGLHQWALRFFRDDPTDEVVTGVLVVLFAVSFVVAAPRRDEEQSGVVAFLRRHDFRVLTAAAVLGWLVLPSHLTELHVINHRVIIVICLFLTLWPPAPASAVQRPKRHRISQLLAAILALIAVGYPWHAADRFAAFEAEVLGDVPAAIAQLPPATMLGYASQWRGNHITYENAPWHIPAGIHAVENGGVSNDSFAIRPYSPIQYLPGVPRPPHPNAHIWDHVGRMDFILWHGQGPAPSDVQDRLRLVFHQRAWWLYRVRGRRSGSSHRFVL